MKIRIFSEFSEVQKQAPSLEEQQLQNEIDKLFKPMDKRVLDFLPKTNPDLSSEAIQSLLRNIPALKTVMEELNSGNGNLEELQKIKETKIDWMNMVSLIARESIKANLSVIDYLNGVFGTNIGPNTPIQVNGGTMTIRDSIIYTFKRTALAQATKQSLWKIQN